MNSYKSFCITIRPRNGLSECTEQAILIWLQKQEYAVAVIEKSDEARHMHCQIWNSEARPRGIICTAMVRISERTIVEWDSAQKKVLRNGIKIAYSDWYLDYLEENEDKKDSEKGQVIYSNPPEISQDYYPTEEEQQKLKDMSGAVDKKYYKFEQEFLIWFSNNSDSKTVTLIKVSEWYSLVMNDERTICVVAEKRRRCDTVKSLYNYITKSCDPSLNMSEKDLTFATEEFFNTKK